MLQCGIALHPRLSLTGRLGTGVQGPFFREFLYSGLPIGQPRFARPERSVLATAPMTPSSTQPSQQAPVRAADKAVGRAMDQDKGKEIAFFDNHAAADSYDVFEPESSARLIQTVVRLGQFAPGARVADLGCGSGVFSGLLRQHGCRCTGLDISPKLIELARRKYPGHRVPRRRRRAPAVCRCELRRRAARRHRPSSAGPLALRGGGAIACCGRAGASSPSIRTG